MVATHPLPQDIETISQAVVALALRSLESRWQLWTHDHNLFLAEFAWNLGIQENASEIPGTFWDLDAQRLFRVLLHERQTRWPSIRAIVCNLEAQVRRGELVFRFELDLEDESPTVTCELEVGPPRPS